MYSHLIWWELHWGLSNLYAILTKRTRRHSGCCICNVDAAWDEKTMNCGIGGFFQAGITYRDSPPLVNFAALFHRFLWLRLLLFLRRLCMMFHQMSNFSWTWVILNLSWRCWGRNAHFQLCLGFYLIYITLALLLIHIFCFCISA